MAGYKEQVRVFYKPRKVMANENPLVSIVIPTYNRGHLIGETIQSVLDQTHTNLELIIVDDGSTDDTQQIVGKFSDPRIRYYYLEHSGLAGTVRTYGIKLANGDYIAFQDSDDLWVRHKLEFQLGLLNRFPECKFIISNAVEFGTSTKLPRECEDLFVGSLFWPLLEGKRFTLCGTSLVMKAEAIDNLQLERLGGTDLELILEVCGAYKGIFTNEKLVRIRKHDQNTSDKYGMERHLAIIQIVTGFYNRGLLQRKQYIERVGLYYYTLGLYYFETKQYGMALDAFWTYVKFSPLHWKGWARVLQVSLQEFASRMKPSIQSPS